MESEIQIPDNTKTLSIVVVALGTRERLLECLQLLKESNVLSSSPGAHSEVVVVDVHLTSDTKRTLRENFPCVRTVAASAEMSFGEALNLGLANTEGDRILVLDAYAELSGRVLPDLEHALDAGTTIAASGPAIIAPDGTELPCVRDAAAPAREEGDTTDGAEWLAATCLMISRRALDDIGLFDANGAAEFEEIEWCARAREAGWEIRHVPGVAVEIAPDDSVLSPDELAAEEPLSTDDDQAEESPFSASRRRHAAKNQRSAAAIAADAIGGAKRLVQTAKAAIGLDAQGRS